MPNLFTMSKLGIFLISCILPARYNNKNTSVFNKFTTSSFDKNNTLRTNLPPVEFLNIEDGIRMYNLPSALVYSSPGIYSRNAVDARTALSLIRDASEVLLVLLENGHSTLAGRLAGAFRNIGRDRIADQIIETLKQAGYDVREEDPFKDKLKITLSGRERSPYVNRIRLMWSQMRETVIRDFPAAPGIPVDRDVYIKDVEDIYSTDAYHSLSIERYRVTPELIAKVSSGAWESLENEDDRKQRDAMAARGYYQAFQEVKRTITAILEEAAPGLQAEKDHSKWYRELFDPSVTS